MQILKCYILVVFKIPFIRLNLSRSIQEKKKLTFWVVIEASGTSLSYTTEKRLTFDRNLLWGIHVGSWSYQLYDAGMIISPCFKKHEEVKVSHNQEVLEPGCDCRFMTPGRSTLASWFLAQFTKLPHSLYSQMRIRRLRGWRDGRITGIKVLNGGTRARIHI